MITGHVVNWGSTKRQSCDGCDIMRKSTPSLSPVCSCGLPLVGVRAQAAGHAHTKDPPERDPAGLQETRIETPALPELLPPPSRLYKNLMREGKHPLLASATASFLNRLVSGHSGGALNELPCLITERWLRGVMFISFTASASASDMHGTLWASWRNYALKVNIMWPLLVVI